MTIRAFVGRRILCVAIILCLSIGVTSCRDSIGRKKRHAHHFETVVRFLEDKLDRYYHEHSRYPDTLADLNIGKLPGGISTNFLTDVTYRAEHSEDGTSRSAGYLLEYEPLASVLSNELNEGASDEAARPDRQQ